MRKRKHRGSGFRDFLKDEGILAEVELVAMKRVIAIQVEELRQRIAISKSEMAARMNTSRAAVDRLLDESNTSVTLNTLGKAAHALGRKLKIELVEA